MKIDSLNEEIGYLKQHYMTEIDALRHEISNIQDQSPYPQYYDEESPADQQQQHWNPLEAYEDRCTPNQNSRLSNHLNGAQTTFDELQAQL